MSTTRRAVQLLVGLWLFGASVALLVRCNLGLDPWDVLHQGLSEQTGISIGLVVIATSVVVLALWVPLHQRPGVGTLANVVLVGLSLDSTLAFLPTPDELPWRIAFLVAGILGNAIATGLYIGAGLGPGPRDGLMTGLAARGVSIRVARTAIEITVLGLGWLLGGTVGVGTVAYALAIGPLAHIFIPLFTIPARSGDPHEAAHHHR
ncbi:MAG: hypothetical protein H0T54_07995 [Geodermatophilaceae bacterium]|nr:hypothetical protein [Geodermatophilaceae bacterium]